MQNRKPLDNDEDSRNTEANRNDSGIRLARRKMVIVRVKKATSKVGAVELSHPCIRSSIRFRSTRGVLGMVGRNHSAGFWLLIRTSAVRCPLMSIRTYGK